MLLHRSQARSGLSLLEVLVALAIFMFSVVVVSQMVDSAAQTALRAQRLNRAALLAESQMGQIVAGILPMQNAVMQPLEEADAGWSYSVTVEPEEWTTVPIDNQNVTGLSAVHVTIHWSGGRPGQELDYTLSRVVLEPQLRMPASATSSSASQGSSMGTGTTTGTTGSGGGNGAGR